MGIKEQLFELSDKEYAVFQARLIPTVPRDRIIGVRTPALRKLAKEMVKSGEHTAFIAELPHTYFDENQLHAFIISAIRDFDLALTETERFLPFIDNWATCDQLSPKVFGKRRNELLPHIKKWLASERTYVVRFGIGMLMEHFLDDDFKPEYAEAVSRIKSDEYYINMMIAWYLATALAKQYDAAVGILKSGCLDKWVQNKTIQKARESYRISDEKKAYLQTLKKQEK